MKANLKNRLNGNQLTIGSWITIGDSSVAEIMATKGFDWLTIDMEHSSLTLHQVKQLVLAVGLHGVIPLVRVGENDPNLIKRVMDSGAGGIIVPMVNSSEDAKRAVASVRYPPSGKRGVGLYRAQEYGFGFDAYKKWVAEESIVIVQIEHYKAVESLKEILAVDGVDGSIIGPYDLSGSLGYPGEFQRPEVISALRSYEDVCETINKPKGFHVVEPDAAIVRSYMERDYSFLAVGLDSLYLGRKCEEIIHKTRMG